MAVRFCVYQQHLLCMRLHHKIFLSPFAHPGSWVFWDRVQVWKME